MPRLSVSVVFAISDFNIPKKTYYVESEETMRGFRSTVITDLYLLKGTIPLEQSINYGFGRIDCEGRFLHFLSDHVQIHVISSSNGKAQPLSVMFLSRSRTEYPLNLAPKDIIEYNKPSKKVKFMKALISEDIHLITKLLNKGLDPNFITPKHHETPVFRWVNISSCLQEAILNLLVRYGAILDFRIPSGICAIHCAIMNQKFDAIKYLYFKGSTFEEWDSEGIPAFFYALDRDVHTRCLEHILEINPSINVTDSNGNNPLHFCCKKGLPNHLSIILKYQSNILGPDAYLDLISAPNGVGNSPLHLAVLQNQKSCVEVLIRFGAPCNVINCSKGTPLDLAIKTGDVNLIHLLQKCEEKQSCDTYSVQDCQSTTTLYSNNILQSSNNNTLKRSTVYVRGVSTIRSMRSSHLSSSNLPNYPLLVTCINNFSAKSESDLTICTGELITIYIVLQTRIAFGSKVFGEKILYGWFPSSCINFSTSKAISKFQRKWCRQEVFAEVLPNLIFNKECSFVPLLLSIDLCSEQKYLGFELGYRRPGSNISVAEKPLSIISSPFYVRNVNCGGSAETAGLRVGDHIAFIMSTDISLHNLKAVSSIIRSYCTSKMPTSSSKMSCNRHISFIVLRHNDSTFNPLVSYNSPLTQDMYTDFGSTENNNYTFHFGTIVSSGSIDVTPSGRSDETKSSVSEIPSVYSEHSTGTSVRVEKEYGVPLPKTPQSGFQLPKSSPQNHFPKPPKLNDSSASSCDSIPLPSSELLCDM